jgi:hypothetical protein
MIHSAHSLARQERTEGMSDEDLAEANSRLESFDVTIYRGDDGRYRIWGDINHIQDIYDSGCVD